MIVAQNQGFWVRCSPHFTLRFIHPEDQLPSNGIDLVKMFETRGGPRISCWSGVNPVGGCRRPMRALFSENVHRETGGAPLCIRQWKQGIQDNVKQGYN